MTTAVYKTSPRRKSNEDKMTLANLLPESRERDYPASSHKGRGTEDGEKNEIIPGSMLT